MCFRPVEQAHLSPDQRQQFLPAEHPCWRLGLTGRRHRGTLWTMGEPEEPLTEWELLLLFEEEGWPPGGGEDGQGGDPEAREPRPQSGSGAAKALPEQESD